MGHWLTPDTLSPGVSHMRRLFIPGDFLMLANVTGALLDMTYPSSWEEFGAVTPDEAAAAALTMYQRFLQESWNMIGAIIPCVNAETPVGCLECDGAQYDGLDYPDLYLILDNAWLDTGTLFHVPDLRETFPMGLSVTKSMGETGGETTHTLSENEMPSHVHSTGNSLTSAAVMPGEGPVLIPNPLPAYTGSTGGDNAHNNLPPYVALRYVLVAV